MKSLTTRNNTRFIIIGLLALITLLLFIILFQYTTIAWMGHHALQAFMGGHATKVWASGHATTAWMGGHAIKTIASIHPFMYGSH